LPNIYGKLDGNNQVEGNMRGKVKQTNSQNLGKEKLASNKKPLLQKLFTIVDPLNMLLIFSSSYLGLRLWFYFLI
jgi:hypothetical protein